MSAVVVPAVRAQLRGLTIAGALRAFVWFAAAGVAATAVPSYAHVAVALRVARDIAAHGNLARVPLGWLGSLAVAGLFRFGGLDALVFASVLAAVGMLLLVEVRAGGANSDGFAVGATLLAAACSLDAFRSPSGAASWFFAALLLLLLDCGTSRTAFAATLLVGIWCSASLGGTYGVVLALLYALGTWCDAPRTSHAWYAFATAVGAIACAALAFALQHVTVAALFAFASDPSGQGTVAVVPAVVAPSAYRFGFATALVSLALVGLRPFRFRDALLVVASVLLALRDGAAVPLVGIVVAPILARAFRDLRRLHVPRGENAPPPRAPHHAASSAVAALGAAALVVTCATASFVAVRPSVRIVAPAYVAALDALARDGATHRVFCAQLEWCSYAFAADRARLTAFADDRATAQSLEVLREQSVIATAAPGWRERLRTHHIGDVIAANPSPLATLLRDDARWRLVRADGDTLSFRRAVRALP